MSTPFDAPLIPGLFIYRDRKNVQKGILFQFNPETLKRSRTVSMTDSSTNQANGTTTGRGNVGRKYSLKANRWKIELELRLDASRRFPKQLGLLLSKTAAAHNLLNLHPLESADAGIRALEELVEPTQTQVSSGRAGGFQENAEPSDVDFYWGHRVWKGFVTSLSFTETLFSSCLKPMMVEAAIGMEIIEPMSAVEAGTLGGTLYHDPSG